MRVRVQVLLYGFLFLLSNGLNGECCGGWFSGFDYGLGESCSWERGDKRCNESEDCCPGKYCTAIGYCEL
jgi:hypothetical protein